MNKFYFYFRYILISRLRWVLKKPYLLTELFKDKKNDFWINYKAKEWFLKNAKNKRVFEFGSGYSTKYINEVAKELISVEDNKDWFETTKAFGKVIFANNKKEYVESIKDKGKFDIIFIDGSYRKECAFFAWDYLKEKGFMIIDDVNFEHFTDFELFKQKHKHFWIGGFKSNTGGYWKTGFVKK